MNGLAKKDLFCVPLAMNRSLCVLFGLLFLVTSAVAEDYGPKRDRKAELRDEGLLIYSTVTSTEASLEVSTEATTETTVEDSDDPRNQPGYCLNGRNLNFVRSNERKLAQHVAVGEGEVVDSLAHLLGVSRNAIPSFLEELRGEYQHLFPRPEQTDAHQLLARICTICSRSDLCGRRNHF